MKGNQQAMKQPMMVNTVRMARPCFRDFFTDREAFSHKEVVARPVLDVVRLILSQAIWMIRGTGELVLLPCPVRSVSDVALVSSKRGME